MIKNFKTADFLLIKAEFLSLDENETFFSWQMVHKKGLSVESGRGRCTVQTGERR